MLIRVIQDRQPAQGFLESHRVAHAASRSGTETPIAPRPSASAIAQIKGNTRSSAVQEPKLPGPGDGLAAAGGAQFPVERLGLRPDGVPRQEHLAGNLGERHVGG